MNFKASLDVECRKEFYENHGWAWVVAIAVTFFSSVAGYFLTGTVGVVVAFILGIAFLFMLPPVRVKVKEIFRVRSE